MKNNKKMFYFLYIVMVVYKTFHIDTSISVFINLKVLFFLEKYLDGSASFPACSHHLFFFNAGSREHWDIAEVCYGFQMGRFG